MIFSNAIQIVRATKGKNIILSSGAEEAFYHRSPYDAINL
jgi:RNase P/RNase MRP subunit p30